MSENGEIYTAGKEFTLPPAVTAWTNLTSECCYPEMNLLSKFFSPILKGQLQRSRCTVPVFIGPVLKCANIGNTQVQINTTATLSYIRPNFAATKYFDNNKN